MAKTSTPSPVQLSVKRGRDKRPSARISGRRRKIAELMKRHLTNEQMAAELKQEGISVSWRTVARDVTFILDDWKQEVLRNVSALKGRELIELDQMEYEAAEGFHKAKTDAIAIKWQSLRLKIKERRAKLCGLDAPILHLSVSQMDKDLREMTDEELDRLLEEYEGNMIDVTPKG